MNRKAAPALMAWGRIDDGFDDHPKVLELLEHERGCAAVGLWTLCFTWAHRNTRKAGKTPGLIPAGLPRRYLGPAARELAGLLVSVGLWDEAEDGWLIHDFGDYLATERTREARARAGRLGAAKRWGTTPGHSKEPGNDSNLPSGSSNLPEASHDVDSKPVASDGKPVASDGSRAPARWAIPNGIAPTPIPKPIPPTAADTSATPQTLIAEWLTHCRKRPPDRVIGQVSRELKALLDEGQDPADVRQGLARWHQAAKHPSTLASFVNEVMNAAPQPRASPRISAADRAVAEAQALKARLTRGEPPT